jgi:hypothetical protein
MSFLDSGLFAALVPLVALPVVIHLLNRGFPRRFKFPSIELIKETLSRRSKIHRWRHLILLLLRAAFLILLLLAFLRPVLRRFGSDPASRVARTVLIVLDHSLSMEHTGDGPTSRERATHEAAKLIDTLGPNDAVNILLMDSEPTTSSITFTKDAAEAKRFLAKLKPGLGRGDVNLANALATRILPKETVRPEVYYISDFQRKNWANANFASLPPAAKLYFVDVGPRHRDNRAILDARLSDSQPLAGDTVPIEITIGNYSSEPFNGRVSLTLDNRLSFDQEVSIAPWSEGKTVAPVPAGGPGPHICEARIPADALEYDNHFFLTFTVQEKEEVLIVTDGPVDPKSGAYFLKAALNPFENGAGPLLPRVISSGELTPARLAGIHKMFFTRLQRLTPQAAGTVAKYLYDGGGLVCFLDGRSDAENLAELEKAIGPNTMPMRLALRRSAANIGSGAQTVARGDFKSRYLKIFQGATRHDLSLLEFYDYYQAAATKAGGELLVFADDSPAMAALHHGLGALLLLNFSADENSSNLARQRIFPAWMQELAKAVSAEEPPPPAHVIGETVVAEVWRDASRNDLLGPTGAKAASQREMVGERLMLSFRPTEPGFYTLKSPRQNYAWGVNPSPDESDLRQIDKDALPREFASDHQAAFVSGRQDFEELAKGRPIFHWFIFAGLLALAMESLFQIATRRRTA